MRRHGECGSRNQSLRLTWLVWKATPALALEVQGATVSHGSLAMSVMEPLRWK